MMLPVSYTHLMKFSAETNNSDITRSDIKNMADLDNLKETYGEYILVANVNDVQDIDIQNINTTRFNEYIVMQP